MKLVQRRHTFNFYESFSDLIFCALVLFVVLVLFLVLKVNRGAVVLQRNQAEHAKAVAGYETAVEHLESARGELNAQQLEVARMMGTNRFSGQVGATTFTLAFKRINDEYRYIPLPPAVVDRFSTRERIDETDQEMFEAGYDLMLEQLRHARPFTEEELLAMIAALERNPPDRGEATGSLHFRTHASASGIASDMLDRNMRQSGSGRIRDFQYYFFNEFIRMISRAPREYPNAPQTIPVLHFTIDAEQQRIVLGHRRFRPRDMVQILGAFGHGGVIVEYAPPEGETLDLPQWVIDDVLEPSGFTNRAPDTSQFSP